MAEAEANAKAAAAEAKVAKAKLKEVKARKSSAAHGAEYEELKAENEKLAAQIEFMKAESLKAAAKPVASGVFSLADFLDKATIKDLKAAIKDGKINESDIPEVESVEEALKFCKEHGI